MFLPFFIKVLQFILQLHLSLSESDRCNRSMKFFSYFSVRYCILQSQQKSNVPARSEFVEKILKTWQDGKLVHCKYLSVVPYKALEKFSKALYGTMERYLQCTSFPSCHERNQFLIFWLWLFPKVLWLASQLLLGHRWMQEWHHSIRLYHQSQCNHFHSPHHCCFRFHRCRLHHYRCYHCLTKVHFQLLFSFSQSCL